MGQRGMARLLNHRALGSLHVWDIFRSVGKGFKPLTPLWCGYIAQQSISFREWYLDGAPENRDEFPKVRAEASHPRCGYKARRPYMGIPGNCDSRALRWRGLSKKSTQGLANVYAYKCTRYTHFLVYAYVYFYGICMRVLLRYMHTCTFSKSSCECLERLNTVH